MEEKNIEFIKMDEGEAEAAKSFIITQLDEYVLPYIYEKNLMFSSEKGSIYSEYLSILKSINPNVKGINPFSIKNIKSLRKNLIRIKFGKKGYLYIFGKKIFGSNND